MNLVHVNDLHIERSGAAVQVWDADGEPVTTLPAAAGWDDQKILLLVRHINEAFARGYAVGEANKTAEFRQLLGLRRECAA